MSQCQVPTRDQDFDLMRCFLLPHLSKREIRTEVIRYPCSLLNNFCVKVHWQENPSCLCMTVCVSVCDWTCMFAVSDSHKASGSPRSICSGCFQVINLTCFQRGRRVGWKDGSSACVVLLQVIAAPQSRELLRVLPSAQRCVNVFNKAICELCLNHFIEVRKCLLSCEIHDAKIRV